MVRGVKVIKRKKQKGNWLLRLAICAFAVYTVVLLVNQQVEISQKRQQLDSLKRQIQIQEIKNEDIKQALSSGVSGNSDYMEQVAREGLDLVKPGERVFVNIAGN